MITGDVPLIVLGIVIKLREEENPTGCIFSCDYNSVDKNTGDC